jgi:hypothetical protein
MTASSKPAPLVSVYDGQQCIGFILARGRSGFEAFTADEKSLGTYTSQRDAAEVISGGRP